MSLIEEALRRIKDPVISASAKTESPPTTKPTEPPPIAHSWPVGTPTRPLASSQHTPAALVLAASLICGLALLLLLGGVSWLKGSFQRIASTQRALAPPAIPVAAPAAALPVVSLQPVSELPHAVAATAHAMPSADGGFVLSGVVEGLGTPYAVINGMVLAVGEQIEGATVMRIADGTVRLRRGDGTEAVLRVPR